jgi:hypothetical protein
MSGEGGGVASSFSRLSALVEDGAIKMIELQAVPRSLSTALGRCLNESGTTSVFLNEPFRRRPQEDAPDLAPAGSTDRWSHNDIDIAAAHLIRTVEPALAQSSTRPVVVVTKNLARYLSVPVFRTWTDTCSAVVWCVRDPRIQISSLVTRTANDLLFGVGSDRLKQSDLLASHLAMVTEFLQDSPWSTDFSKTGWRAIGAHFTDRLGRRPSFVADASLFSRAPEVLLRYLCGALGIEFRNDMIDSWGQPFLNVDRLYNPDLTDTTDAWVKHAATSHGVEATDRAPLEATVLPAALRDHLFDVAVPIYERFMREFHSQEQLGQHRLDVQDSPPS